MTKIADISIRRNGLKKVTFFELGIYRVLKQELGFRFVKYKGKGYYLRYNNGALNHVAFHSLRDAFIEYLEKHFTRLPISKEIEFEAFINEFYCQIPIKRNPGWQGFLNEDFVIDDVKLSQVLNK